MAKSVFDVSNNQCYGCSACSAVCKFGAIKIVNSNIGTYVKNVDVNKCKMCGQCFDVCPVLNQTIAKSTYSPKAYAVVNNNETIRRESTSGGAFSAFADCLIRKKAVIYGAAFYENRVLHLRIDSGDISLLRKSKYVQSDLGESFKSIANDLYEGRIVLFCGNPCQCDGLKSFLFSSNISIENLYIVDFICHGVLSPKIFSDYLKWRETKTNKKIINHLFRSKADGWHASTVKIIYEDGTSDVGLDAQMILRMYMFGYGYKESCYSCKYTSLNRVSDITLGDFWGIEKHTQEFADDKGVSFVMLNTKKGEELFNDSKDHIKFLETPIEWTEQPHFSCPVQRPDKANDFWKFYYNHSLELTADKFLYGGILRGALRRLWHVIR